MPPSIQIFQHVVTVLPLIGLKGHTYYVPNGNGNDLDEYVADSLGQLRFVGARPSFQSSTNAVKIKNILGETMGGGSLVYISNNKIFKYNQSDLSLYNKALGFTNHSGVLNEEVDIVISGESIQFGGLITGEQYYANDNGLITNIPPNLNVFQPVGVAKNPTTLIINIQNPYIRI